MIKKHERERIEAFKEEEMHLEDEMEAVIKTTFLVVMIFLINRYKESKTSDRIPCRFVKKCWRSDLKN